jgi:hypothetical protein
LARSGNSAIDQAGDIGVIQSGEQPASA